MTIDERLEALVGRHEALAQSVELLTLDVRGLIEHGERVDNALLVLIESQQQTDKAILVITQMLQDHETRLDKGKL